MFSVNEYYRVNPVAAKTTRHLQKFASLDEARVCADDAYREIRRVPESEMVWIGVLDENRNAIVYTQPEKPFSETRP